ncbi:MAG: HD domain-containing protein [candidate division Zixibacteria bacterium]|nr:HD domain-containing protein [candidate division Zixibacteria bacterium]
MKNDDFPPRYLFEFLKIKEYINHSINTTVQDNPLDSSIPILVSNLHKLAISRIPDVYLLTIAVKYENIFDIAFPSGADTRKYFRIISFDSYIGKCCRKHKDDPDNNIFILNGKEEMCFEEEISQKDYFIRDKQMNCFCVVPLVFADEIVGSIQLSLMNELSSTDEVSMFLLSAKSYFNEMIAYEQSRLTGIIEAADIAVEALGCRDEFQAEHSKNVAKLVEAFLEYIRQSEQYRDMFFGSPIGGMNYAKLKLSALLHDIGKIAIPSRSFSQIDSLEDSCYRHIHPYYTYQILSTCKLTKSIASQSANHHERVDGAGYPFHVNPNLITAEEQIIAFADKLDSMARDRPERPVAKTFEDYKNDLKRDRFKNAFSKEIYLILLSITSTFSNEDKIPVGIKRILSHAARPLVILQQRRADRQSIENLNDHINSLRNKVVKNQWICMFAVSTRNANSIIDSASSDYIKFSPEFGEIIKDNYSGWNKNFDVSIEEINDFINNVAIYASKDFNSEPQGYSIYIGYYVTHPEVNRVFSYAFFRAIAHSLSDDEKLLAALINSRYLKQKDAIIRTGSSLVDKLINFDKYFVGKWGLLHEPFSI